MHWRRPTSLPKPPIQEFERGASVLTLFFFLLPFALVGGVCLGYAVIAPELVQYEQRVEAQALRPR